MNPKHVCGGDVAQAALAGSLHYFVLPNGRDAAVGCPFVDSSLFCANLFRENAAGPKFAD